MNKTRIAAGILSAAMTLSFSGPWKAAAVNRPAANPGTAVSGSAATTSSVKVTVDGLNIRKNASANSKITGSLDVGAVIKISDTKKDSRGNTWGKLSNGKGWVNLKYTSKTTEKESDAQKEQKGTAVSSYNVKVGCELNVRKSVGTSGAVVDNLKKNAVVTIVEEKKDSRGNTWGKLSNGKGWINLKYTSKTSEQNKESGAQKEQKGTAASSYNVKVGCELNVRKSVGTSGAVVDNLKKNAVVTIVEEKKDSRGNTWGKLSNGKGWINLKYTSKTSEQNKESGAQKEQQGTAVSSYNVKVSCELNVRKSVGTSSAVVDTLKKNAVVSIAETKKDSRGNTWGKLSNGKGWINLKYTSKTSEQNKESGAQKEQKGTAVSSYNVKAGCDLNVRKSASLSGAVVDTLKKNAVVTIVEEKKDNRGKTWGKLSNGKGWISLQYTSKTSEKSSQKETAGKTEQKQDQNPSFTSYQVKVTNAALNVRKSASGTSEIVGTLYQGDVVTITDEVRFGGKAVWGKLSDGKGWISLRFTEKKN